MTGIIVAGIIIGLVCLVGGIALFMLLPLLLAAAGTLLLVLAMLVVGIMLLPTFVTLDDLKPDILALVKESTGREITIGGPIGFTIWPVLGLQLRDISVGNPSGFADPIMFSAQDLSIGVTLSSLLNHKLDVREFRLSGGQINLSVNEKGQGNWVFVPAGQDEAAEVTKEEGALSLQEINIQNVAIKETDLSYGTVDLMDIDMDFSMPSLDDPARLTGEAHYNDKLLSLKLEAASLGKLLRGEKSDLSLAVAEGNANRMALTGQASSKGIEGNLDATVASVADVLALAGSSATVPFKEVALKGNLSAAMGDMALEDMTLRMDDVIVTGKARYNGTVKANVDVSALNLDNYAAQGESENASSAPDLSALNSIDANITARLAGLIVKGVELGKTTADVNLNNGKLNASITPATLYGGTVEGKLGLSANNTFTLNTTLKNVDMEPMLTKFASYDRLSGHGDAGLSVSGNLENMKSSVNGHGYFNLKDGALKGVNIAALIRRAKAMLSVSAPPDDNAPVQTDFTELTGSFTILEGVVSNNNLKMLSPLVRLTGKGTANLPTSTLNYRAETSLVADLTGQGGVLQRKGLIIPINITGTFDNLSYTPDLQGLVLGNLDAAGQAVEVVKNLDRDSLEQGAKGALEGLLGGGQPKPPAEGSEAKPAPVVNPLQSLFGQ